MKYNFNQRLSAILVSGITALMPAMASTPDEIEINFLGVNNTLVKVKGDDRLLVLPVQESNDDARINVLVDGKIAETIYVRLAKSKTNYTVPFDLSPYKGKMVVLDVVTPQGRQSVREAQGDVCWKGMELVDKFDTSNKEKFRPAYHHTPLYGWMNDPNGMFYKDGVWNLYYQYNPYGSKWQNMTWGHSTSEDLINWKHEPIAIRPDGLGSIFSGSCVVDSKNTAGFGENEVIALYTSAGTSQMQSLAHSSDNGLTFTKLPSNPVLTLESEARDPNMFWNETTGEWNLVLAHALDKEMLFFTSPDLKTWTLQSGFGKGLGAQDGVWECPDLLQLPVEGSDEKKWVLIVNLNPGGPFGGSAIQYFVGDWDGRKFTVENAGDGSVPTKWLDYGKDNYALVSFSGAPDDRHTVIGWMSNWQYAAEVPTMQFRSANTLPRDLKIFKGDDGNSYVASVPSPELLALRGKAVASSSGATIGRKSLSYSLPSNGLCEIVADFTANKSQKVVLTLSNKNGEKTLMTYDATNHTLTFDRSKSGIVGFSEDFPVNSVSPTFEKYGKISLRIFIDRSSIEVFGNDGRFVMTNLVFPNYPYTTLTLSSENGNSRLTNLKVYPILK